MSTHTPIPYAVGQRVRRGYTGEIGTVTAVTHDRMSVTLDGGGTDSQPLHFRGYRILPAVDSNYRDETPADMPDDAHWIDRVVTQGHADYCDAWGHAGVNRCPRCGEVPPLAEYSTPAQGTPVSTPDGQGIMVGVTGSLYAVEYPNDIPTIGIAAGSVIGYQPSDVSPIAEAPAPTGHAYSFYVGSTAQFDAHLHPTPLGHPIIPIVARMGHVEHVYGMWEGTAENVAIYRGMAPDDAAAQRMAYGLAVTTGNECIMVTRDATQADCERSMSSTREYRVTSDLVLEGNRTLSHNPRTYDTAQHTPASWGPGRRFTPDVHGDEIAYLVHADASVTSVR